jgi:hypothetical protein
VSARDVIRRALGRAPLDEMADPAHNPDLDRHEATLRRVLHGDDDTDGLTIPPPPWETR